MILKVLLSILIVIPSYACEKDVTYLEKDKTAPCSGYLFSPQKESEVRYKVETFDYIKAFAEKQGEIITIMDERITNLQEHNKMLSNELNKRDKTKFWESAFYFGLGVIITGAIAKNVP